MRFDGHKYRDCRWCRGVGCIYCQQEADAEYKRQFPDGPRPIITIDITTLADGGVTRRALVNDGSSRTADRDRELAAALAGFLKTAAI